MRKILSLLVAVMMVMTTSVTVFAEDAAETSVPDKVEISFKVGDSTLMINGNSVEVETPYIAGEGTTLVPLRVITEAFGAKVTWVAETKEILLEYPDVNITLQIDNATAKVNDHTETLPVAPVLSPNGVTMVPLRFISETFGATVGYDDLTAAITVVKENVAEDDMISSSTDLPRIGDSYWKWSMLTPAGMMMTDRYSDGTSTTFEDGDNSFYVDIYDFSEYYDEDKDILALDYEYIKEKYYSGLTLSKDEKGVDAFGHPTFRLIGRNKAEYVDHYVVADGMLIYEVCFFTTPDDENLASLTNIIDSFKLEFAANEEEKAQTHDLSNVDEDGYRVVKDEDLGISLKVPANYREEMDDVLNLLYYTKGDDYVTVGIYSKSDDCTANSEASSDRDYHANYYNNSISTTEPLKEYTLTPTGENAVYYVFESNTAADGNYVMYDVYFEKGDYIYNVTVNNKKDDGAIFNAVMNSLNVEDIDSSVAGVFLRDRRNMGEKEISHDTWKMTLNESWTESAASGSRKLFKNAYTGSVLAVTATKYSDISYKSAMSAANAFYSSQKEYGKSIQKVTSKKIGNKTFYSFVFEVTSEEDGSVMYYTCYITEMGRSLYTFELYEQQLYANAKEKADIEEAFKTLTSK